MHTQTISQRLLPIATQLTIPKGQIILALNEVTETFYFLQTGEVLVREELLNGQQTNLKFLHAGDCFGEIELFTEQKKTYEVSATQPCTLLKIDKQQLDALMQQDFTVTRYIIEQIIAKLSASSENLIRQSVMKTADRILVKIYEYAQLDLLDQLTKQKLAQETNTTLRSVNRAIETFRQKGWLTYQDKQIHLLSPPKIETYLTETWDISTDD